MKREKAAISIFLIIIVMASVILGGIFIDFTRVLVAKNKVRAANESAVRSCLADYNAALVSDWGLFGVLESDIKSDFPKYVKANLHSDEEDKSAAILHFENIYTEVEAKKDLGDSEVFQQKINEYSKYRAPVSLTMGVIDKFKAVFGGDTSALNDASTDIGDKMSKTSKAVKNSYSNLQNNFPTKIINDKNKYKKYAGLENTNASYLNYKEINKTTLNTEMKKEIDTALQNARDLLNKYNEELNNYNTESGNLNEMTKGLQGSIDAASVTDDKNIVTDDNKIISDNDKTYKNTAVGDDKAKQTTDKETVVMNNVKNQVQNSLNIINSIKSDEIIKPVLEKAEDYNTAAKEFNTLCNTLKERGTAYSYSNQYMNNNIFNRSKSQLDSVRDSYKQVIDYANSTLNSKVTDADNNINNYNNTVKEIKNKLDSEDFQDICTAASKGDSTAIIRYRAEISLLEEKFKNSGTYAGNAWSNMNDIISFANGKVSSEKNDNKLTWNAVTDTEFAVIDIGDTDPDSKEIISNIQKYRNAMYANYGTYSNVYNNYNRYKGYVSAIKNFDNNTTVEKFIYTNHDDLCTLIDKRAAVTKAKTEYDKSIDTVDNINLKEKAQVSSIQNFIKKAEASASGDYDEDLGDDEDDEKFSVSDLKETLKQIEEEIESLTNEMPAAGIGKNGDSVSDAKYLELFEKIYKYFKNLFEAIKNPGDKIYLVDYVMSNCTFVTSQTDRNHYFKHGEVEYIIYGKQKEYENIACAVGEVALIRFAINAVNYWITTPGGLISRTITALVRGLVQTIDDMRVMMLDKGTGDAKGKIALCPSLSKTKILTYSDHLRLLLLLKMSDDGGAGALRRCMHVTLSNNYQQPISDPYAGGTKFMGDFKTEITGKTEADVDLFFVNAFLPEFVNFGNIHDGKYRVSTTVTYGY